MKLANLASLAVTCILLTTVAADAGGDSTARTPRPPIPDAKKIIAACEAKFQKQLDTGITSEMRLGTRNMASCIRAAIVDNMVILSSEKQRPKIIKYLDQIEQGVGGLYWFLYNGIDACYAESSGGCGTIWQVFGDSEVEETYKKILIDTIEQRKELNW